MLDAQDLAAPVDLNVVLRVYGALDVVLQRGQAADALVRGHRQIIEMAIVFRGLLPNSDLEQLRCQRNLLDWLALSER